jgi:hypothetical protein
MLITGVVLEHTNYLPRTLDGCWPYSGPESMVAMFNYLGVGNENGAGGACEDWVGEWIVAIVIM